MNSGIRSIFRQMGRRLLQGCLALLAIFLLCGSLQAGLDPYGNRILDDVRVGGLDVGGMSLEEACRALNNASEAVLEGTVLAVELPEETLYLSPADTKIQLKTFPAALAAFRAGRIQDAPSSIGLKSYLKVDEAYIRQVLSDYANRYDTDVTPSQYCLTGQMPDLEIETAQPGKSSQTLVLTMGIPTARLDQEDALHQILSVYDSAFSAAEAGDYCATGPFRVDILEEPEMPDLEDIYRDVYVAPVDDALDMEHYSILQGAYGYGFDPDLAKKTVNMAAYGQKLYLPMELLEPDIFGEDVYYNDILGYCETPHTRDENRNHNLRMACAAMDGMILQPGEVFSYNDTLGPRTKDRGYKRAGAYSGWELVLSYGGGICQGSTTVYGAVLYADLEIVHRRNHGYAVSYVDPGLDATVNWGGPDFQFRNSSHFPIKIAAEVSDGLVKVTILGTEERDYYVEMESEAVWGNDTIYAKSYKCKYDRQTGELISREMEARSNYMR